MPERVESDVSLERRGVSFRTLALGALAAVGLAALGVWVAYRELIYYERRAAEHLPADVGFAARLDLEQVLLFEPVRRHLLPLLDKLPLTTATPGHAAPEAADRLTRLREIAGINLGLDLREILIASSASTDDWVVVLGGLFPKQGLVIAVESLLRADKVAGLARHEDMLLFAPWGIALGQADDGILIVASSRQMLESTLPATQRFIELGLPRTGAGGLFAKPALIRRWLGPVAWVAEAGLSKLRRIGVTLRLGAELELEGRVEVAAASDLPFVVSGLEGWLQPANPASGFIPQADWGGERAVLARTKLSPESETAVKLRSSWQRSELDRAARSLASWLERRFLSPRSSKPD